MRSKIWFLAAACAVIALALGFWWSMGEKEKPRQNAVVVQEDKIVPKTETRECPRHQKTTREDAPQELAEEKIGAVPATGWEEPVQREEAEPEQELVTIQGVVEYMDSCTQTIVVDGTSIDASRQGNFPDYYQAYKEGDFVEVTYRKKRAGNLLNSIEILQKK